MRFKTINRSDPNLFQNNVLCVLIHMTMMSQWNSWLYACLHDVSLFLYSCLDFPPPAIASESRVVACSRE